MAGAGFDAKMIRDADGGPEGQGRPARLRVDRRPEPQLRARPHAHPGRRREVVRRQGQLRALRQRRHAHRRAHRVPGRRPDDGVLEVGVVTAKGRCSGPGCWPAWPRARRRAFEVHPSDLRPQDRRSSRREALPYELDGGDRPATKRMKVRIEPAAHHRLRPVGAGLVSTATLVPETWELTGDDARQTLMRTGRRRLLSRRLPAPPRRRRLQPRAVAGLHDLARARAGHHRRRRRGQRASGDRTSSGAMVIRTIHNAVPGRPARCSPPPPARAARRHLQPLPARSRLGLGRHAGRRARPRSASSNGASTASTASSWTGPWSQKYGLALLLLAPHGRAADRRGLRRPRLRRRRRRLVAQRQPSARVWNTAALAGCARVDGRRHRAAVPVVPAGAASPAGRGWRSARPSRSACGSSSRVGLGELVLA